MVFTISKIIFIVVYTDNDNKFIFIVYTNLYYKTTSSEEFICDILQ